MTDNRLLDYSTIQSLTRGTWLIPPTNKKAILKGGAFDTRNLAGKEIFFALDGEKANGHDYLDKLAGSNIQLAIVSKPIAAPEAIPTLQVKDSLQALHKMARFLAFNFQGRIVAITGSSGKTSFKNQLAHLLSGAFQVLASPGSFNNHIGCPITVLSLEKDTEVMVLEMGTSGTGEIMELTSIAPADVSVLLNIGHAHLGKFGSLEALKAGKLEIFSHQRPGATSLVPAGDERLQAPGRLTFGAGGVFEADVTEVNPSGQRIILKAFEESLRIFVPQIGAHLADSLAACWAVCGVLGMNSQKFAQRAETLLPSPGRAEPKHPLAGYLLIDDSYNANPDSVVNLAKTIQSGCQARRIAVIGHLAELEDDLAVSKEVLAEGLKNKLDFLFLNGPTGEMLEPYLKEKLTDTVVEYLPTWKQIYVKLEALELKEGDWLGIKGSRSAHMERLVNTLLGKPAGCDKTPCFLLTNCTECGDLSTGPS